MKLRTWDEIIRDDLTLCCREDRPMTYTQIVALVKHIWPRADLHSVLLRPDNGYDITLVDNGTYQSPYHRFNSYGAVTCHKACIEASRLLVANVQEPGTPSE